jgi:hypothetical protein
MPQYRDALFSLFSSLGLSHPLAYHCHAVLLAINPVLYAEIPRGKQPYGAPKFGTLLSLRLTELSLL